MALHKYEVLTVINRNKTFRSDQSRECATKSDVSEIASVPIFRNCLLNKTPVYRRLSSVSPSSETNVMNKIQHSEDSVLQHQGPTQRSKSTQDLG